MINRGNIQKLVASSSHRHRKTSQQGPGAVARELLRVNVHSKEVLYNAHRGRALQPPSLVPCLIRPIMSIALLVGIFTAHQVPLPPPDQ